MFYNFEFGKTAPFPDRNAAGRPVSNKKRYVSNKKNGSPKKKQDVLSCQKRNFFTH